MTATLNELLVLALWNVTALVSLIVALIGMGGALADWEYLAFRRLNGLRQIQAGANLRTQVTRAVVSLLFLLIGLLALMEAPYRAEISRWMLIAASAVLGGSAVWDWIDRRRAIQLLIHEGEEPEP